MTYALIAGGGGLAVGLALMIWALTERSKRAKAERQRDEEYKHAAELNLVATRNGIHAAELAKQLQRVEEQLAHLRQALTDTTERLRSCRDPQSLADWLKAELQFDNNGAE